MTIDEAINHCKEVADINMKQVENEDWKKGSLTERACIECANEYLQFAQWLKELKACKESCKVLEQEPRTGLWMKDEHGGSFDWICSSCGSHHKALYDYCPSCDAKMGEDVCYKWYKEKYTAEKLYKEKYTAEKLYDAMRLIYDNTDEGGISYSDIVLIFGADSACSILHKFSAKEIIDKVEEYKEKKEQEGEIQVGDALKYADEIDEDDALEHVVTYIDADHKHYDCICTDGTVYQDMDVHNMVKTGNRYEITFTEKSRRDT